MARSSSSLGLLENLQSAEGKGRMSWSEAGAAARRSQWVVDPEVTSENVYAGL